jgi:hypothetical protein
MCEALSLRWEDLHEMDGGPVLVVRRMRAYRFPGGQRIVSARQADEADLDADQRFDVLGWDIFMLVLAGGGSETVAASLAMEGTLRQRQAVRRDRLRSAIARIDEEDKAASVPRRRRAA